MDEPVPIRRAAVGCLVLALILAAIALVVRLAIFSAAPPRDDTVVTIATAAEVAGGPIRRDLILSRSRGWSGERDAGNGRVQVAVIVTQTTSGGIVAVNAASPGRADCPVEIAADRLTDCDDRAWTFEGIPIDAADPPLERIAANVTSGSVVLRMTEALGD
ncbi:MAG: hypothetical protein QOI85_848 [Chloroflexota bacterium]|jgi:hypothetical protein|nr:hypothetical protein [Chloroflexota bacterium]